MPPKAPSPPSHHPPRRTRRALAGVAGLALALLAAPALPALPASPDRTDRTDPTDRGGAPFVASGLVHEQWTVEDGLPVNALTQVIQTRDSYLWIATFDGLVRFDGVRFTVFNTARTPALRNNRIVALHEAADGTLWIRTLTGDLVRRRAGELTTIVPAIEPDDRSGRTGWVDVMYEDRDGTMLAGGPAGVFRVHGDRLEPWIAGKGSGLGAPVTALLRDRAGRLWIGTERGLVVVRDGSSERIGPEHLSGPRVMFLAEGPDGSIWIATNRGVDRCPPTGATAPEGAPRGPTPERAVERVVDAGDISRVDADASGALWLAAGRDLLRWSPGADGLHRVAHSDSPLPARRRVVVSDPDGAVWVIHGHAVFRDGEEVLRLEDDLTSIAVDSEGTIWLATHSQGLHALRPARVSVLGKREGLVHDNVYPLHQTADGAIWIGTQGGLDRWQDGSLTHYGRADGLANLLVQSIFQDAGGTLWVGVKDAPIERWDGDRFVPAVAPAAAAGGGVVPRDVLAIAQTRDGTLLAGTRDGLYQSVGPGRGRESGGGMPRWRRRDDVGSVWVTTLLETWDGAVWVGTAGDGVLRLDSGRASGGGPGPGGRGGLGEVTRIGTAQGLPSDLVRALHQDARGTLWIGTEDLGLCALDPRRVPPHGPVGHLDVAVLQEDDGLWSNGIHRILEGGLGHFWMSSNRGIFRVRIDDLYRWLAGDLERVPSVAYTERDGLRNREANGGVQGAGIRTRDGRLLFPTQAGVVIIDPRTALHALRPPRVHVEQVASGGSPVAPVPPEDGAVVLEAPQRSFEVRYTGLSFRAPRRMRFRYRLEGYEREWVDAATRRAAFYTQVPPGRYTFRVQAASGDGVWNTTGDSLTIVVRPFAWETWWFRVAGVGALALLGTVAVRRRTLRQRARERELDRRIAERTATIRDHAERLREAEALRSRLFVNISHEFRTPLTLTLGPLQDLEDGAFGALGPEVARQVDLARRSAERMLELVDQLLDVARLEGGRLELRARPLDLAAFLRVHGERFTPLAERQRVRFDVALPRGDDAGDPVEVWADPAQLDKVVGNLLSNAFKFTPEGGTVRLSLEHPARETGAEAETVEVRVRDTGPGIPAAEREKIFDRFYQVETASTRRWPGAGLGLALARDLAALHGGSLRVESEEGFGSTFILTLRLGSGHLPEGFRAAPGTAGTAGETERGAADAARGRALADPVAPVERVARAHPAGPPQQPAPAVPVAEQASAVCEPRGPEDLPDDPSEAPPDEPADRTTVLVVDDNADVRSYVRRWLEPAYRVLEAADGAAGLALARERLPDLVLSDVMMPGIDGNRLCRELKEDPALAWIPVVLLTARATADARIDGLRDGADDYLTKPFDARELVARVDNLIASRRRLLRHAAAAPGPAYPIQASEVEVTSADAAFLERVRERIEEHLGDPDLTVELLARSLGCDRSYLFRKLRDLAGTTPSDLVRHLRLERACRLLEGGAGTVSEIAYGVGFKSVSHFSQRFREAYGEPPSARLARTGLTDSASSTD